jgi:cytoskeleton protein RodZ
MPTRGGNGGPIAVGPILKQTRERGGIELATVEEETKIRAKYLRALEDEDWDVLPGPAYTRGFIRAYAELLGLDSEVLVDEYRRRHEQPPTERYELPEPLLGGRSARERVASPTARYAVLGSLAAAAAVVLLVLGVTAGSDDDGDGGSPAGGRDNEGRKDAKRDRGSNGSTPADLPDKVTVKLVARSDVQACLIDNRDRVLIPDQLLTTGVEDGPYVAKRFRLELDPGEARVVVNGERAAVPRSSEPAAYRLTPRGVRATEFTGRLCE